MLFNINMLHAREAFGMRNAINTLDRTLGGQPMEEGRAMKKKLLWVILGLFLCFAPAGTGWSANLLGDADFETNTGKWTESCSLTGSAIATQDPSFAHSPSRFAWMGG